MAAPGVAEQPVRALAVRAWALRVRARARPPRNRTASRKRGPRRDTRMSGIAVWMLTSWTPARSKSAAPGTARAMSFHSRPRSVLVGVWYRVPR